MMLSHQRVPLKAKQLISTDHSLPQCSNHYIHDCYYVDIEDPKYNSFTHVPQCPLKRGATVDIHSTVKKSCMLMCLQFKMIKCINVVVVAHSAETIGQPGSTSGHNTWTFTHHCTITSCKFGKNKAYGSDDQCLVWMHMQKSTV